MSKVLQVVTQMATEGFLAGAQNAGMQVADNAIAQQLYERERTLFENTGLASGEGAAVGSVMSIITSAISHGRASRPVTSREIEQTQNYITLEPAGVRFSKQERPHRLAQPIDLNYKTHDERLRDPAYVLEGLLRGSGGSSKDQRGKYGRQLASSSELSAWAAIHGRNVRSPDIFSAYEFSGGEHVVFRDPATGRLVKLTKPGLFGAQAEDAGAYLERMALSNRIFGDDIKFEGIVTLPGEDAPRAVISQPFVKGRDATPEEQAEFLKSKGFVEHDKKWVHPILGVEVWDTQTPGNVIRKPDGTMQPIDLQVQPASADTLRAVRAESGLGQDSVFSKTEANHPTRSGSSPIEVRGWVDDILADWGSRLDVVVHDSASAIPDARLRSEVENVGENVEAFFDSRDGKIHLLADRVGSRADAERQLRHEGIHWVIAGPMREEYEALLGGVRKLIGEEEWARLSKNYPNASEHVRVEEYLAYLGQTNPRASAWRSFVYEFKQALRKYLGAAVEFTDADVLAFLQKANRNLERGEIGTRNLLSQLTGDNDVLERSDSGEDVRFSFSREPVQVGSENDLKQIIEGVRVGKIERNQDVRLGWTPKVLKDLGASDVQLNIRASVIKKAFDKHSIEPANLLGALTGVSRPMMILRNTSANGVGDVLVFPGVLQNGKPLVIALKFDSVSNRYRVNDIVTVHIKDRFVQDFARWQEGGLVLYTDPEKGKDWFRELAGR